MIVDQEYYLNEYKGESINDFDKLNIASQSIIEYMTLKGESFLKTSPFLDNVKKAICSEIEYLSKNGGLKTIQGNKVDLKSETIGSYSYVKNDKNKEEAITYIKGIPIAPMVEIYLIPTGLLYCGV